MSQAQVREQLHDLMVKFESLGLTNPHLRHVLAVFPDDRNDLALGPPGMLPKGSATVDVLDIHGAMIACNPIQVLRAPKMTPQGMGLDLPCGAYNITPEARRQFIAEPGLMASSVIVYEGRLSQDPGHKTFESLATDTVRCIQAIAGSIAEHIPEDLKNSKISCLEQWWLFLLHELAWLGEQGSLIRAKRSVWVVTGQDNVAYIDYESAAKYGQEGMPPVFGEAFKAQVKSPPDFFVSVLEKDVFTASAYAIKYILHRLDSLGKKQRTIRSIIGSVGRVVLWVFAAIGALASLVFLLDYFGMKMK